MESNIATIITIFSVVATVLMAITARQNYHLLRPKTKLEFAFTYYDNATYITLNNVGDKGIFIKEAKFSFNTELVKLTNNYFKEKRVLPDVIYNTYIPCNNGIKFFIGETSYLGKNLKLIKAECDIEYKVGNKTAITSIQVVQEIENFNAIPEMNGLVGVENSLFQIQIGVKELNSTLLKMHKTYVDMFNIDDLDEYPIISINSELVCINKSTINHTFNQCVNGEDIHTKPVLDRQLYQLTLHLYNFCYSNDCYDKLLSKYISHINEAKKNNSKIIINFTENGSVRKGELFLHNFDTDRFILGTNNSIIGVPVDGVRYNYASVNTLKMWLYLV